MLPASCSWGWMPSQPPSEQTSQSPVWAKKRPRLEGQSWGVQVAAPLLPQSAAPPRGPRPVNGPQPKGALRALALTPAHGQVWRQLSPWGRGLSLSQDPSALGSTSARQPWSPLLMGTVWRWRSCRHCLRSELATSSPPKPPSLICSGHPPRLLTGLRGRPAVCRCLCGPACSLSHLAQSPASLSLKGTQSGHVQQ